MSWHIQPLPLYRNIIIQCDGAATAAGCAVLFSPRRCERWKRKRLQS